MDKNGLAFESRASEKIVERYGIGENIATQLKIAGRVQRDFLPATLPDNDRLRWDTVFMPAEYVSGDIYDVARIDEDHIGFYIADVVGHGIAAALLTIFVKQAMAMRETFADSYKIFSPVEVVKNLNSRIIAQNLSDNQFITCCYCLVNTKTLELSYARAGHPYPLHIRGDGTICQLESRGSLLGVFEDAEFEQGHIQLEAEDKFFVYSDGLESYVGDFVNGKGFTISDDFANMCCGDVSSLMDKLSARINRDLESESQFDDITAVGLDVLKKS
ncbi:MAG: serine/threonine-protein phosphatase [Phycisphaerae bacterium]|nr:serine/threonine-protein phosphatase [Phycisphaerae bacterium]